MHGVFLTYGESFDSVFKHSITSRCGSGCTQKRAEEDLTNKPAKFQDLSFLFNLL